MANQPLYICINDHANQAWGQTAHSYSNLCMKCIFFYRESLSTERSTFYEKKYLSNARSIFLFYFRKKYLFLGGRSTFSQKEISFYWKKYLSTERSTFLREELPFLGRSTFFQKEVTFYRKKYLSSSTERSNFLKIEVTFCRKK